MVKHAHGEHRVEAFQLARQFFQGQRQVPGRQLGQVLAGGKELAGLKRRREAEAKLWQSG